MGIRASFTGAQTIDISSIADDMLAQVIADHAAERFRPANRANRQVAGGDITYTVTVDGRVVHAGKGDLFPTNQVAVVVRRTPGRRHSVTVDWLWHKLQGVTLARAVDAYWQIQSAAQFLGIWSNPQAGLARWLLLRYLHHRYPAVMARLALYDQRIDTAKKLYRLYRWSKIAGGLLPSGSGGGESGVLAWIARELRERSPVMSGAYRDAHALYGDGRMIMGAGDITSDSEVPEAKEYSFSNAVPYSRRLEFGKTKSGRDFLISVPNRIYERVAADARSKFGEIASFEYTSLPIIGGEQVSSRRAGARGRNARYPTIIVRMR